MCGLCFGDTFSLIKCNLGVVIGVVPLFLLSLLLLLHSLCFSPISVFAISALSFCCLVTNVLQLQSYCVGAMPEKSLVHRQARLDGGFRVTACSVSQIRLRFTYSCRDTALVSQSLLCLRLCHCKVAEPLTALPAS